MRWSKRISLGQHTLVDFQIRKKIIEASQINKHEIVCEAGTGNGMLTYELCRHSKSVISYEIDSILFAKASKRTLPNLKLVNADIFKIGNLNFDVFVSNLPYSKSKDAFNWLPFQKFDRAIVMVQKEFAAKLQASPGEKNYRAISVVTQHCFNIQRLFNVDRKAFDPEPSIESEVIKIVPKKHSRITHIIIKNIYFLFSQRNRMATSVARKFGSKVDFGDTRIGRLNVEEMIQLARSRKYSRRI
jgi:16S rRNA (adenine1518-N6/adenine1519-N6)-dimethyltransferase